MFEALGFEAWRGFVGKTDEAVALLADARTGLMFGGRVGGWRSGMETFESSSCN